jgi:LEA14-like dessication related protein
MMTPFKKYGYIVLISTAILVILSGCPKPGTHLVSPKISLVNIQVLDIKLFETTLKIDLRVLNPNNIPLQLKGTDCDLELNGKKFASGVSDEQVKIPAFGTAIVPMTIYSSMFDVVQSLIKTEKRQKLNYRIKGRVHLSGGSLLSPVIPFTSEGSISLDTDTQSLQ